MAVSQDPGVVAKLEALAERFFADAAAVDGAQRIPTEHVDGLAEAGLYGVFAPVPDGGLGFVEEEVFSAVELLASACLASTFVWVQHFGLLGELLEPSTPAALKAELLPGAVQGLVKGGLALAGLLPGPPRLRAVQARDGWLLEGEAPCVSGWGVVDLLVVAARGPDETVVRLLVDAKPQPGLSVSPLRLSALNATATARLGFGGVFVDGWRCTAQRPYDAARQQTERLRLNGSLALGVAREVLRPYRAVPAGRGADALPC